MADNQEREIDPVSGMATTGHAWDDVKELNTPLPKWWLNIFYATIVWSLGYILLYPAIPLVNSFTTGFLGTTARQEVTADLDALRALRATHQTRLGAASLEEITRDPGLLAIAVAQGKAAFGDNCAGCHGLAATGAPGFPNLRDDSWLWGGSLDAIQQTIRHGVRNSDDRSRTGQMPAFGGANGILRREEIVTVANHVRSLAGLPTRAGFNAAQGAELFATNCASCHGEQGRGNPEFGAPNLRAQAWLYGGSEEQIVETITLGRGGVMPAWIGRLDDTTIKALSVYVHSLGGGS